MDNILALSYISKMGGTKNVTLFKIAKDVWDFCLPKEVFFDKGILALYFEQVILLGISKPQQLQQVETESSSVQPAPEVNGSNERGPVCFQSQFSAELVCQLEARSRSLEEQCSEFVLEKIKGYAFPLFVLIGRVLAKVHRDKATLVLITPLWQAQPWFPTLPQLSISAPTLLPQSSDLLSDPEGHPHSLIMKNRLPLVAWKVSGRNSPIREFQSKLPLLSKNVEEP